MSSKRTHQFIYCAENRRQCPGRSNIYLYPVWHCGIENVTFDIPHLCFQKKKKRGGGNMEMFDKLLSGQKQKRDGGGRCWWQVYYATEATGEANNWEMELSQHFAESTTPKGVTLSLVKTRQNYSLRHLESVSQAMPVLCICDKIEKLICSVYYLVTDPCGNP